MKAGNKILALPGINQITRKINLKDPIFLKSFVSAGLISGFKLFNGILIVKAIALIGGVAGMPMGGNYINVAQIAQILSTAGISMGIIKYLSQHARGTGEYTNYLASAFYLTLFFSLVSAVGLILLSPLLSLYFFNSAHYFYYYVLLGVSAFFFGLNNFLISYYNSSQNFKDYLILNGINSFLGFVFIMLTMVLNSKLLLFVSIAFYQTFGFFLIGFRKLLHIWNREIRNEARQFFNKARPLLAFGYYSVQNIVVIGLSQILVRGFISQNSGLVSAGLWDGMMRISSSYLGFFILFLTLFFIPIFSSSSLNDSIALIARKGKALILLMIAILSFVYLFKGFFLNLFLSEEFADTADLMPWFFAGDVLRFAGYIIAILYLSRGKIFMVALSDLFFNGIFFCLFNYFFIEMKGLQGSGMAYLLNYVLYFCFMAFWLLRHKQSLSNTPVE